MILTADGQRRVEAKAVELGLSLETLMERAGSALYDVIAERHRRPRGVRCALLCGRGGNGGDGFVCARLLKENGALPVVLLCAGEPTDGDAKATYDRAVAAGVPVIDAAANEPDVLAELAQAAVVVDAVYGIGFHGALPDLTAQLFAACAKNDESYKISADIPSGVSADGGAACADAFHADLTLAMVARKPAHLFKATRGYCGEVRTPDLGVPQAAFAGEDIDVLSAAAMRPLLPIRGEMTHKGDHGRLLAVAGSDRYRGAATLCVQGALACGAGLVSVASGEKVLEAVAAQCPEAILIDIKNDPKFFLDSLRGASAVAIGCGLSQTNSARGLVQDALAQAAGTLVFDADGINLLAENRNLVKGHRQPLILTPHIGEFARLCQLEIEAVLADRIGLALRYAVEWDAVVVLKSDNTVVAAPDGRVRVCTIGNAGLAKGGSGDLLCGCIASFAAMGVAPADAAMLGVWAHSRAADLARAALPMHSMTASAVATYLPDAIAELDS